MTRAHKKKQNKNQQATAQTKKFLVAEKHEFNFHY